MQVEPPLPPILHPPILPLYIGLYRLLIFLKVLL